LFCPSLQHFFNLCKLYLNTPQKQAIARKIEALVERILVVEGGGNRETNCGMVDLEVVGFMLVGFMAMGLVAIGFMAMGHRLYGGFGGGGVGV